MVAGPTDAILSIARLVVTATAVRGRGILLIIHYRGASDWSA
jgi:hypothetical protein